MRHALLWLVLLVVPAVAGANDWDALESPSAIVLMRQALAPGTGDPAAFDLRDCGTQRNLDARGQAQARRIGVALRDRNIHFDGVRTSQWCRCRDTTRLLDLGSVLEAPALNSFLPGATRRPGRPRTRWRFFQRTRAAA